MNTKVTRSSRRTARVLFALSLLFIVYATTFPWNFDRPPTLGDAKLWATFKDGIHQVEPWTDILQNIGLFLPLGWFFVPAFLGSQSKLTYRNIAFGTLVALVISCSAELVQSMSTDRTTNLMDVVANTIGGATGVVLSVHYESTGRARARSYLDAILVKAPGLVPVLGLCLCTCAVLDLSWTFSMIVLVFWTIGTHVALHRFSWTWDRPLGQLSKSSMLIWAAALLPIIFRALVPFEFRAYDPKMWDRPWVDSMPFMHVFYGLDARTFLNVFKVVATYAPLGWIAAARNNRRVHAIVVATSCALILEAAQLFVVGRTVDLTEAILAGLGAERAWTLYMLLGVRVDKPGQLSDVAAK